jgi:hypothetical protein
MATRPEDLRRRVTGWRRAERREQAVRAQSGLMNPEAAIDAAVDLADLLPSHLCEPDETRAREVEHARRAWRTLRTRLMRR